MTAQDRMEELRRTARAAGVLILVTAVFAIFGMVYVDSAIIVPDDAAATARNIATSGGLFRLGMASQAVVFLIEIWLVGLFYVLLEPVSRTLSLVAAFARLAMTIVQGVNLLNKFLALLVLSGAGYLSALAPEQLQALALLFLNGHAFVVQIWGLFFGLHLLLLGYLVNRSGYIPRILGALLTIIGLNYLAQSLGVVLSPRAAQVLAPLAFIGYLELIWPLWLVIKGVSAAPGQTTALEAS